MKKSPYELIKRLEITGLPSGGDQNTSILENYQLDFMAKEYQNKPPKFRGNTTLNLKDLKSSDKQPKEGKIGEIPSRFLDYAKESDLANLVKFINQSYINNCFATDKILIDRRFMIVSIDELTAYYKSNHHIIIILYDIRSGFQQIIASCILERIGESELYFNCLVIDHQTNKELAIPFLKASCDFSKDFFKMDKIDRVSCHIDSLFPKSLDFYFSNGFKLTGNTKTLKQLINSYELIVDLIELVYIFKPNK